MLYPPEPLRRAKACSRCRARKVKCNGSLPCDKCMRHNAPCEHSAPRRGRASRSSDLQHTAQGSLDRTSVFKHYRQPDTAWTESRRQPSSAEHDTHVNTLGSFLSPASFIPGARQTADSQSEPTIVSAPQNRMPSPVSSAASFNSTSLQDSGFEMQPVLVLSSISPSEPIFVSGMTRGELGSGGEQFSTTGQEQVERINHGAGSWLSVCSKPGLAWVAERTGEGGFAEAAKEMMTSWIKRLTLNNSMLPNGLSSEPDPASAWNFVNAYFEDAEDSFYGVVHRPEFEQSLRAYLAGQYTGANNVAWRVLRKTVYASGSRIYLAKNTNMSFQDIQKQSWGYFQDALADLMELLFTPTGILAIRALLAMTFFFGGLGCPSLEYMLCVNAVRLTHSKGLHRQPSPDLSLSADHIRHRNWLFWAVYCREKQICQRAGRPSTIEDDDISCDIPSDVSAGSKIDVQAFVAIICQAQISSQVSRKLLSANGLRQSLGSVLDTVLDLDQQMRAWKASLPEEYRPATNLVSFQTSTKIPSKVAIALHYAYYGTLIYIHILFAYPWVTSAMFGHSKTARYEEQKVTSSQVVYSAARNILIIAKSQEIKPDSSQWAAFYFPMLGIINLFIHVLKNPASTFAKSDLALLEVAAGHFSEMDFVTNGEMSYHFPRHVASLARKAMQKASELSNSQDPFKDGGIAHLREINVEDEFIFPSMDDSNFVDWDISVPFSNENLLEEHVI